MPQANTGFASVKLPTAFVNQARDAAQPMRRSVAGQVEWSSKESAGACWKRQCHRAAGA